MIQQSIAKTAPTHNNCNDRTRVSTGETLSHFAKVSMQQGDISAKHTTTSTCKPSLRDGPELYRTSAHTQKVRLRILEATTRNPISRTAYEDDIPHHLSTNRHHARSLSPRRPSGQIHRCLLSFPQTSGQAADTRSVSTISPPYHTRMK